MKRKIHIDDIYADRKGILWRVDEKHSGYVWLRNENGDLIEKRDSEMSNLKYKPNIKIRKYI